MVRFSFRFSIQTDASAFRLGAKLRVGAVQEFINGWIKRREIQVRFLATKLGDPSQGAPDGAGNQGFIRCFLAALWLDAKDFLLPILVQHFFENAKPFDSGFAASSGESFNGFIADFD